MRRAFSHWFLNEMQNLVDYLRYGIPDFKLAKGDVIDRRLQGVRGQEGISFETNAHVGKNISCSKFD